MKVQHAESDAAINACFEVFLELRPHLTETLFLEQVKRQMQNHGYVMVYIEDNGKVVAAAGFRIAEFLAWGKALYVDDLVTLGSDRCKGYGSALMDWLLEEATRQGCDQFHLDSGHQRHDAHRLYLNKKLMINAHHFAKVLE